MEINQLYSFALTIVLVGLIVGVGVLVLDKFGTTSGVGSSASTAINASRDAVGDIADTWMTLIVTIGVMALIIFLVVRSFAGGRQ
jgi:hypothetical protein